MIKNVQTIMDDLILIECQYFILELVIIRVPMDVDIEIFEE